jgi:vanadium-dependent haloperoxidase-like protein
MCGSAGRLGAVEDAPDASREIVMTGPDRRPLAQRWLAARTTLIVMGLMPAASVSATEPTDMVLVWNQNAVNVISQSATPPVTDPPTPAGLGQGPPLSTLHVAMVHGAIYDAVNAIDGGHEPYLEGLSAAPGASMAAAVAQAGHDVLYGITPPTNTAVRSRIDALLTASLDLIPDGDAKDDGRDIGAEAADAMLDARANDGRFDVEPFVPSSDPNEVGTWRLVPPANANVLGQFATVTPLTLKSPNQFPTEGMPALTSAQYAAEFNEVKALGAQSGSSRTEAQTLMAGFYSANPTLFYNTGLRVIATEEGLSTSEQALLFAKTSMAGADALISCWSNKKLWNAWRPQTAIREAANDGNPLTEPDEDWLSLFATAGYPDEPSGYNCYTGGFWQSARYFFGNDKMNFSLTSPGVPANAAVGNPVGVPGSIRTYTRFTDVIDETIDGRILNGFHFRTADVHGAWIGKKTAQWIDKHYFAPVD